MELPQLKYTCRLCPHECSLSQGEAGKCLIRKGHYVMPYSTCFTDYEDDSKGVPVAVMAIEPLSKKPIYHFLDKDTKTLSLGGYGCSMSCDFCQNWKVSQQKPEKIRDMTTVDILEAAEDYEVVCFTYNEPTLYYPFINNLANALKNEGKHLVAKTNAYVNHFYWKRFCESVHAMNIDFKGSEKRHMEMIGIKEGTYDVILDNMLTAIDDPRVHVEISIPVFEDYVNEDIDPLIEVLEQSANEVPLHLLRVFPVNRLKGRPTKRDKLEELKDKLFKYSNKIYIQNVYGK